MKKVFYSSHLAKLLRYAHTITIGPFILTKRKKLDQSVINHECVHVRQWAELTLANWFIMWLLSLMINLSTWWFILPVVVFYLWYGAEYLIRLAILKTHKEAYRAISFEQEARLAENDENYLENSRYFSWIKFLNK